MIDEFSGWQNGLRDRLRHDTGRHHARVDAAFSALDLTRLDDYRLFLRAHECAIAAIRAGLRAEAGIGRMLDDLLSRLRADLAALDRPCAMRVGAAQLDPLAVRYVITGSRLGARMLRRRWEGASDPRVRAAGAYLCADPRPQEWRMLCAALARMPAHGARADAVVRDASAAFVVFQSALATAARPDAADGGVIA